MFLDLETVQRFGVSFFLYQFVLRVRVVFVLKIQPVDCFLFGSTSVSYCFNIKVLSSLCHSACATEGVADVKPPSIYILSTIYCKNVNYSHST